MTPLHLKLFYLALAVNPSLTEMTHLPSPLKKRKEEKRKEWKEKKKMKNHIIKIKASSCAQLQLKNFNTAVENSIM